MASLSGPTLLVKNPETTSGGKERRKSNDKGGGKD
jgi:hypothetical protein